jgi:tRNA threonylcarbamoyladenosine biosynthesis protein TsaE
MVEVLSASPHETLNMGAVLAGWLRDGDVVLMHGDLGAGKTTLTKGIAAALGIDAVVSSPSFSLVNEYDTGPSGPVTRLFHLDLYRLQGAEDLASIGFDDFTAPADGVTIVEWPERALTALPDRYLLIEIEQHGPNSRILRFVPFPDDDSWNNRLVKLRSNLAVAGR